MKKKLLSSSLILVIVLFPFFVKAGNPYKSTGPYGVNCTWYTWDKVKSMRGIFLPAWGNAKTWYSSAESAGFKVGSKPKNNSIIVWDITEYGHVAYVEKVSGDYMYIWDSDRYCIDEEDPTFIECDNNSYDESSQAACRKNAKRAACKLETSIYTTEYKTIGFIYLDEVPNNINQSNSSTKEDNGNNKQNFENNDVKKEEQEVVKSDNNYLQEIILSSGSLDFKKDILTYDVTVENEVDELEINAKTEDSKATIKGSGIYQVRVGNNLIKLDVVAENGDTLEYTINVLRKEIVNDDNLPEDSENEKIGKDDNSNKKVMHLSNYLEILFGVIAIIAGFRVYIIKRKIS